MCWRVLAVLLLVTVVSVLALPLQPAPADHNAAYRDALPQSQNAARYRRSSRVPSDDIEDIDDVATDVGDEEQRFRREAHPGHGEESKRGFQPWGGKRQAEIPEATWDALEDEEALVAARAFNPWGGKRSDLGTSLKRKFQPWGGKRQAPDVEDLKRRFNPWAGKRSSGSEHVDLDEAVLPEVDNDDAMGKRGFQPWGGKRSSFQPWGGKRSAFQPWGGKRSAFQPWGGKRSSFQPWGGKRSSFQPWGGKRAKFQPWGGKRAKFQPWGGKRSAMGYVQELEKEEQKRQQAFQPWAGKRNSDNDESADLSELFDTVDLN